MINVGLKGEASVDVTKANTAIEVGSGSVPVFATPMLVALMEDAAVKAVKESLPEGQTTVGIRVGVAHSAATPVGMTVTARAELVEVDGRRLVFQVMAEDGSGQVGQGTHERFMVDMVKFMVKAEQRRV